MNPTERTAIGLVAAGALAAFLMTFGEMETKPEIATATAQPFAAVATTEPLRYQTRPCDPNLPGCSPPQSWQYANIYSCTERTGRGGQRQPPLCQKVKPAFTDPVIYGGPNTNSVGKITHWTWWKTPAEQTLYMTPGFNLVPLPADAVIVE